MNESVGFFAVVLATNLRYRPHHRAWQVTQMSTGRLRRTRKLRSRSAACSAYRVKASTSKITSTHDVQNTFPVLNGERPRRATTRVAASDVRDECEWADADGVSVLESVVDSHGGVPDDADPGKNSKRQDCVGVIATGREGIGTRVARPQFSARLLLEHAQPAGMVGMRL